MYAVMSQYTKAVIEVLVFYISIQTKAKVMHNYVLTTKSHDFIYISKLGLANLHYHIAYTMVPCHESCKQNLFQLLLH